MHIQFDGFYLTRGHYSNNMLLHVTAQLPSTMRRLAKLLRILTPNKARPTMLRHQATENSLATSGAAKNELFSSRDNCSCWILKQLERTSYFLGIQAWVLRQNEENNNAQKSGQQRAFFILIFLFFIMSQDACLNFFKTAFELLLYRKCGEKV